MKKTSVIYARVSTAKQAQKELPIASMLERQRAKAAALDSTVLIEFVDKGKSGRSDKRAEFSAMMNYCSLHSPDYLICWSTSRFARNQYDAVVYKRKLKDYGVKLVYVSMDLDSETDAGWVAEGIMELVDELKSRDTARDTIRSMISNARSGYWNGGHPPLGYKVTPDPCNQKKRRLAVVEEEAEQVKRIFHYKLEGMGGKSIAQKLDFAGETNRGKKWTKSAVLSLLRNQSVTGKIAFGKKDRHTGRLRPVAEWVVVPAHPAIIDQAKFDLVKKVMDAETNPRISGSPSSTHLFTGVLVCGDCGSSLQTETATGRGGKRYSYYRCRESKQNGSCDAGRIPGRQLDDWLKGEVISRVFNKNNLISIMHKLRKSSEKWASEQSIKKREVRASLAKTESKRARLYEQLEAAGDALNLADIAPRLREHTDRIAQLEAEITKLEKEPPPRSNIGPSDIFKIRQVLIETLAVETNSHKIRRLFSELLESIEINAHNATIKYRPQVILAGGRGQAVHSEKGWLPETSLLRTRRVGLELPENLRRSA